MLRPSLEEVKALAKQYNTIPVFYEFSADNQTPLNIYRAFSQESRNSFILESVSNGVQWDRYSFVGFSPKEEIRITGNTAEIRSGEKSETFEALSIRYQVSGIKPGYSISRYLKRTVRYILLALY